MVLTTGVERWWRLGLLAIGISALLIRLWGLNAAGETWDEIAYYNAAHRYYNNVQHRIWDADAWDANREHPAIGKWLYVAASIGPFQTDVADFGPGRALSALLGSLTVILTGLIGTRLYSRRVGLIAAGILALIPSWIALNRVLGLDTPTAFFFALTTWLLVEGLSRERGSGWWWTAATVALGLGIGTRLSNLLLPPFLAAVVLLYRWPRWSRGKQLGELVWIVPFIVVPAAIVYGTWPWLWENTQAHWEITIGHWSPVSGTFFGVIQFPGWSYFLMYYLVSLPALVVLLSLWFLARTLVRGTRSDWLIIGWILAVFAFSAYGLRQGGIRYLAQLFPAVAIASAVVFDDILTRMKQPSTRHGLIALLAGYLFLHAVWHQPYQLDYYNEFTGGVARVARNQTFQVGWWNEGVEHTVTWLNEHAPEGSSLWYAPIPDRSQWRLRQDFIRTMALPDYIVLNTSARWQVSEWPALERYRQVYTVEVRGASLAEVWERVQ